MISTIKKITSGVVPSDIGALRIKRDNHGFTVSRADGKHIKDGDQVFESYYISSSGLGGVDVKGMVGIGPKRAKFFNHGTRTSPRFEVLNAALNFCAETGAIR